MSMFNINSKTLKSLTNLLITSATRSEEFIDNLGSAAVHTSAMLDDLAADGHHATSSAGAFNRLTRNQKLAKQYKDAEFDLPEELLALT